MHMTPAIAAAIASVCRDVRQLGADERNYHGKYNFVSVDKFYLAVGPLLAKYGLSTLSTVTRAEIVETSNEDGKVRSHLHTSWDIYLVHEDGSVAGPFRRDVTVIASGPQSYASAESFANKYFLRSTFKIPTGDQDDADMSTLDPIPPMSQQMRDHARPPQQISGQKQAQAAVPPARGAQNERVLAFVREVNAFFDKGNGLPEFVSWCNSDPTVDSRMTKIEGGSLDAIPEVVALKARIASMGEA